MTELPAIATSSIDEFRRIVGDPHVRAAVQEDAVDGVQPRWIIEPGSAEEVASTLAAANRIGLRVVPRGSGTKIDWGRPPGGADLILSTVRLNQVLEHAAGDMTATVQAGATLAAFQTTLAQNGQRLAIDPLFPDRATIGGVLATNDSGPLRATFGSVRDHLIGITIALSDGTIARSGGKVVKNVAGYDLPKLFIGSFGTLGVITEATFRLYPLPKATRVLRLAINDVEMLSMALASIAGCSLITTAVQIASQEPGGFEIFVLIEGLPDTIDTKVARVLQSLKEGSIAAISIEAEAIAFGTSLFESSAATCIASVGLLSTDLPKLCAFLSKSSLSLSYQYQIIAQAVGTGKIAIQTDQPSKLVEIIKSLRTWLQPLGGHLTLLRCPVEMKQQINVWPEVGNALPVMRKIKQQFDPRVTLCPGRFVGGI